MDKWRMHLVIPDDLDRIDMILRSWETPGGCGGTIQAGDIGCKLRFGRQATAESLLEW